MVNVAIYVRLSDEDKDKQHETDESESVQNQKAMLYDYCKEQNWDVFDIYCDEDYSGMDRNRPDFKRMLSDCENGYINVVLCKSQSRFSRDMEVIERYIHNKFLEWKVRFISVVDRADSFDTSNKKARQINGLINEWYLEDASENIRKTLQSKKKRGEYTGSFAPYGYIINPYNKHQLIIDEHVAPIVRDIFNWYLQGWGYRKIVMKLNELGIPSPTLYKQQQNSKYVNTFAESSPSKGLWTHTSVYRIIRNETYTGTLVQGKSRNISYKNRKKELVPEKDWIRVPNCHEPIIDELTWLRALERIAGNTRARKLTQEVGVFSGKVRCALCRAPMKRCTYYNKNRTIQYYNLICATYMNGSKNCTNVSVIHGKQFEPAILTQFNTWIKEFCNIAEIKIQSDYDIKLGWLNSEIEKIRSLMDRTEIRKKGLYEDKLDGIISREDFITFNHKYEKELSDLQLKLKNIEIQAKAIRQTGFDKEYKKRLIEKYICIKVLTRPLVEDFIEIIYIGEKIEGQEREITVHWKF